MKNFTTLLTSILSLIFIPIAVYGQLSGVKTIGGENPDFTNFETAINALNAQGTASPGVTFLVRSGVYNENPLLSITDHNGPENHSIVFRPDQDAQVVVNFDIPDFGWGFRIQNSHNVFFYGVPLNAESTQVRSMTINGNRINEADQFFTVYVSNGSENSGFRNLVITHEDNNSRTGFSLPVYISTYQVTEPPLGMRNIVVSDCHIIGGNTYGVFIDGDPDKKVVNTRISNNKIQDFARFGILLQSNVDSTLIDGNEIFQTFEGRSAVYGMSIGGSNHYNIFSNNYIHSLICSELAGLRGIQLNPGTTHNLIFNNVMHIVPAPTNNASYGLYILGGDNANNQIYHNSIYLGGVSTRNVSSYALRVSKDVSNDVMFNNVLVNERTGGTANHYALALRAITFAESDYNFLSVMSDQPGDNRFVARIGVGTSAVDYNTLADLQNDPLYGPRDQNSLSGDPFWTLPSLIIDENSPLVNSGTPVPIVATDILGNPRSTIEPDMGAYEYQAPLVCLPPAELWVSSLSGTSATLHWSAQGNEDTWDLIWGLAGFDPEHQGTLLEGIANNTTVLVELIPETQYEFRVRSICGEESTTWSDAKVFATPLPVFIITAQAHENGAVEPSGQIEVEQGSDLLITIVADQGYRIADVKVDGESVGAPNEWLFENIQLDHSLEAFFELKSFNLGFEITDADANVINDAVVALNGNANQPGDYVFQGLNPGTYSYLIARSGYFEVAGTVEISDEDILVQVVMQVDDTSLYEHDIAFRVYPNPASSYFKWDAAAVVRKIDVYDAFGRLLITFQVPPSGAAIQTEGWAAGVYLVTFHTDDKLIVRKLVIE